MARRMCCRQGCSRTALATLTYDYADQLAVLGPLSMRARVGTYDLCQEHADLTSAPQGWQVLRLPGPDPAEERARADADLVALAEAIREVGLRHDELEPELTSAPSGLPDSVVVLAEKGHLRMIADR